MGARPARIAIATVALFFARTGAAHGGDPVAAEALFREARAAIAKGDYATACPKLAESHRLDPAAGTLLNLGECTEHLGKLATAWQHYREAADMLVGDERREIAHRHIVALEPRLPHLTVELAADAPKATAVARDGVALARGSLGVALPIDPGDHLIEVSAPGRETSSLRVHVDEGESKSVDVSPGAPIPSDARGEPPSRPDEPAPAHTTRRTVGFVVGGAGIVSLAVGAVAGVLTLDRKSTVERLCPAQACTSAEGTDAASEGRTFGVVSTATLAVGIAAVGVGTYLVLSSGPASSSRASVYPTRGGAALAFAHVF